MEYPPKDENLIDTEKGLGVAEEFLNDFDLRLKEAENVEDPSKKILTFLELSKEAFRRGDKELASELNKKAIELDNAQNEFFEKETRFKVAKMTDEIARFKYNKNQPSEVLDQEEFPIEKFEEFEEKKVNEPVVEKKKTLGKRLVSALNNFFSF